MFSKIKKQHTGAEIGNSDLSHHLIYNGQPYPIFRNHITGLDKQIFERKIVNTFLPISLNVCFGCSKEPSH